MWCQNLAQCQTFVSYLVSSLTFTKFTKKKRGNKDEKYQIPNHNFYFFFFSNLNCNLTEPTSPYHPLNSGQKYQAPLGIFYSWSTFFFRFGRSLTIGIFFLFFFMMWYSDFLEHSTKPWARAILPSHKITRFFIFGINKS